MVPHPQELPSLPDPDAYGFNISREQFGALTYLYRLGKMAIIREFQVDDVEPWIHHLGSYQGDDNPHMMLTSYSLDTNETIGRLSFYADMRNARFGIDKHTQFYVAPLTIKTPQFDPLHIAMLRRCLTMTVPAHEFFARNKS